MNKRIVIVIVVILGCFNIAGGLIGGEAGLKKHLPLDSSRYPKRMISLIPSVTEELYLLGVEKNLIGCTTYCVRPEEAKNKERVGNNLVINIERVVRLKPDLVFVAEYTDHKILKRLQQFSIPVKMFPTPKSFGEICDAFLDLGAVVGRTRRALEIIRKIKMKVRHIRDRARKKEKVRVFFQLGGNPLFGATGISFTNDYIEFAGGINIIKDAGKGIISREQVIRKNPEVILIVDMGIKARTARTAWKKFSALSAVKKNRIYIVDANKYCLPSPSSFLETLEEVALLFHPISRSQ